MKIYKSYRYIGLNGTLITPILLPDIKNYPYLNIIADEGKILTDGFEYRTNVTIPEEEKQKWTEIDA